MILEVTRWMRVAEKVMKAGVSPCPRDGHSYKAKWSQILLDYKRIYNYHSRSGQNIHDFWSLTCDQQKLEGLPKQFL